MSYLQVKQLVKSYGDRAVLDGIGFDVNAGERVGLVGANGAGKTTLMRILAGLEEPDQGQVRAAGRFGYLPQSPEPFAGTLEEYFRGYAGAGEAPAKLVRQAGLPAGLLQSRFADLSGGEKTRAGLARVLGSGPEWLLLDEPTNHLDLAGIDWLTEAIRRFFGAVLVISHDRRFLDQTVTRILELEAGQLRDYTGNYSFYAGQKQLQRTRDEEEYQAYLAEKRRLTEAFRDKMDQAARTGKIKGPRNSPETRKSQDHDFYAGKAKKVAKKAKAIEKRLEMLEPKAKPAANPRIWLELDSKEGAVSKILAEGTDLAKSFAGRSILAGIGFQIPNGARIALTGPNGSGKTTLLRLITGELTPDRGSLRLAPSVRLGLIDQELRFLDDERRIVDEVAAVASNPVAVRNLLGCLLFRGDAVFKRIGVLSRGERVRVALAKLILSGCNLLLLDEPTNHLDLPSREAVEEALLDYPGTMLLVSHDRYFLEKLSTMVWSLDGGGLAVFSGGFQEYEEARRRPKERDPDQRLVLETKLALLSAAMSGAAAGEMERLEREYLAVAAELRQWRN